MWLAQITRAISTIDAAKPARVQRRPGGTFGRGVAPAWLMRATIGPPAVALKRPARRPAASAAVRPAKRRAPSVPPWTGSTARSGWGIRPRTRRFVERTPAMSVARAVGVGGVAEGDAVLAVEAGEGLGIGEVVAVVVGDREA